MPNNDPHSYSELTQGRIAHIDLQITVDFEQRVLHIQASYRLDRPVSGSLFLDTRDLHIERVQAAGQDLAWEVDAGDDILGERLHLRELDGVTQFTIELTTSPQAGALQWMEPALTAGGQHPFLYSQCQALQARSIFPCQDSPSVRFTFTAQVQVVKPLRAVLAAEHCGTKDAGESCIFRFRMEQPIPSYLFAIAVGNLAFREFGPRTGIYAEPESLEEAAWEFAENEDKLAEAEKLLGPYLWGRYDIVLMPPAFPFGAMENPRLTFVSPIFVVGDRTQTIVISHELAHAWTGNLVTNATWEDFWLNEGWTVYAESRITEVLEGADISQLLNGIWRLAMLDDMRRFGMDADETRLKYSQRGIDPDEVFSYIPYIKGYSFVLLLERAVGREVFDRFLARYIETFSFQSLTTEEFVSFLQQELPEAVERVDVAEWLYAPGYPQSAPRLYSRLIDEVEEAVVAYRDGQLPTREQVAGWHRHQVLYLLHLLPEKLPAEDCRTLEHLFDLSNSRDAMLLGRFYVLAIGSGYEETFPGIERLVASVGRSHVIRALFHRLAAAEWSRPLARPLWERCRQRHHPMTVASIDNILAAAGL